MMRSTILLAALTITLSSVSASAAPHDVAAYIDRRLGCNHWADEDGYDANRRAEIKRAVADLRCATLDQDELALRRRYRHDPAILRQIGEARDAYPD